jgi:cytoskeletal protein CcmA (bactofilin family)
MALFSKEPETNSRPEHSHEPSQSLVALEIQSLAGENVAPARDAAPTCAKPASRRANRSMARAYLDSGTKINGKLSFEGPGQIDGQIEGEIVAGDDLVIGQSALVTAKIKAASVVVAGTVSGEITATQRIEIRPSAKISGNLAAPRMVMHEGAVFDGHCAMKPEERVLDHSWFSGLSFSVHLLSAPAISRTILPGSALPAASAAF